MTQGQLFQATMLYASDNKAGAFVFENAFAASSYLLGRKISSVICRIGKSDETSGMAARRDMNGVMEDTQEIADDLCEIKTAFIAIRKVKLLPERSDEVTGEVMRVIFTDFECKLLNAIERVSKRRSEEHAQRGISSMALYSEIESAKEIDDCLLNILSALFELDRDLSYAMILYSKILEEQR